MTQRFACLLIGLGLFAAAQADVWTWVDADGAVHYVNSDTPIWTWVDAAGIVHYSDKPEDQDAVRVALVWYSGGDLPDQRQIQAELRSPGPAIDPNETEEERAEREAAEAYYCKQARQIYDTYLAAPSLYRHTADGEREYLSEEEAAAKLEETLLRVTELCDH